jgi:hypothetical protein
MRRPAADTKLSSSRKTAKRCSGNGGNAVAGAAVRVALGSVCRQHVRDVARVRRVCLDRDYRAALRADRGVGPGRCGAGGGGRGGRAARSVGRIPSEAAGDGCDGSGSIRGRDKRPRRFRVRLAQLRPASDRVDHRRRSRHRVQGGQRPLPEDAGAAGGPAGCEQPVRVHDLAIYVRRLGSARSAGESRRRH